MYCYNCGNKLPDDANFCDNCGAKMEKEAVETEETPEIYIESEEVTDDAPSFDIAFGAVEVPAVEEVPEVTETPEVVVDFGAVDIPVVE